MGDGASQMQARFMSKEGEERSFSNVAHKINGWASAAPRQTRRSLGFFAMFLSNPLIRVHEHSVLTAAGTLSYNYPFVKETHHPLISLDPLTLPH